MLPEVNHADIYRKLYLAMRDHNSRFNTIQLYLLSSLHNAFRIDVLPSDPVLPEAIYIPSQAALLWKFANESASPTNDGQVF